MVQPAALILEVCAVGKAQGAWARVVLDAPVIDAGNIPIGSDTLDGVLNQVAEKMAEEVTAREALDTRLSGITSDLADAVAELDGAVDGVGAGMTVLQGAIDATAADLTAARTELSEQIGDQAAAIGSLQTTVNTNAQTTATRIDGIQTRMGDAESAITAEQTARTNADTAMGSRIDGIETSSAAGVASAISESRTASGDLREELERLGWALANVRAAAGNETRSTRAALAITTERLMVEVGSSRALISAMELAYADADRALAQRITSMEAAAASNAAAITREEQVRADAVSALLSSLSTMSTRVGAAETAVTDEIAARSSADNALANRSTAIEASIGKQPNGSLVSIAGTYATQTALATLNSAVVQQKADLKAEIDGALGSVSVQAVASATKPTGAVAAYHIVVKAGSGANDMAQGGLMVAVYGTPGNYTSKLFLMADATTFWSGSGAGTPLVTIGPDGMFLNLDLVGKRITAAHLNVATLSAIVANLGTITAGIMQSPNGRFVINLTEGWWAIWSNPA
ncbi:hypothetical protein [Castellaniella sp.]|uniref:hypothetical protein n=1 Tax=Castellaniella sp. TaxID=1955812 RepID=UPI002AFFA275|nr:hypothetical protein [Castellaniella sp.]